MGFVFLPNFYFRISPFHVEELKTDNGDSIDRNCQQKYKEKKNVFNVNEIQTQ